jgi:hypothetical protein
MLDITLRRIAQGEIDGIEAIEDLFADELVVREKPPGQGGITDGQVAYPQDGVIPSVWGAGRTC